MKNPILIILVSCFVFVATAHPPRKVVLNTDHKSKLLKINISHTVKDTETHFISKVIITLNGQLLEEKTFTKQSTAGKETITITVDEMKVGDKIEVECICNKSGRKKASAEVKSYNTQSK